MHDGVRIHEDVRCVVCEACEDVWDVVVRGCSGEGVQW